jgi:bacillithiol system protein YtxJ
MSFFNNFFGGSEQSSTSKIEWRALTNFGHLNELIELSHEKPVVIFKHSTRCSISRFALKQFENDYDFSSEELQPYFLDLLQYRSISNEIASRFGVFHQSPQILVIKEGKSIYNDSHDSITVSEIKNVLNN